VTDADHDFVTQVRTQLENMLGSPFVDGNHVQALQNGAEIFPAMLDALEQAKSSIDFLTYVYWEGDIAREFAETLADRAKDGLRVRVLLDSFGASEMSEDLLSLIKDAGAEVRWFRPLSTWRIWRSDKRTHRKILITDNERGFTGGVGIAEEWTGDAGGPNEWRDTHFAFKGPAVRSLNAAFMDNWNECGEWTWDEVHAPPAEFEDGVPVQVVRASSTIGWSDTAALLRAMITISRRSLTIVTPYFVPDEQLRSLLCAAAKRGVDVNLMIPGQYCDARTSQLAGQPSYGPLLDAGVNLWRYQKTMLHAKLTIVDSQFSCIGSANLNHRSMGKDEECCAVVISGKIAEQLEQRFQADCEFSEQVSLEEWRKRGSWMRAKEWLAGRFIEQL